MAELNINIRFAQEEDAHTIATIHIISREKTYRQHIPEAALGDVSVSEKTQFWHDLIKNNVKVLVIEQNKKIVGFASLCPSRDADTNQKTCGEISAIYLSPEVWHQGLGKQLCHTALVELKKMGFNNVILWVLRDNAQARKFYESMGFVLTGDSKAEQCEGDVVLNEVRYRKEINE